MGKQTDKVNVFGADLRRILTAQYARGRDDAFEEAAAAARDKVLLVGVVFGLVGMAAGVAVGAAL